MRNPITKLIAPISIIIIASLMRLFPHLPNFAPIGAMALFGGVYLNKKFSIIVVIFAMLLSDYLLLYVNPFSANWINLKTIYPPHALIHSTTIFVYGSFLINILIGWLIAKNKSITSVAAASLVASLQFFLITNFGVWAMGAYSRGIDGLIQSYIMGLPFFKYTLIGDLFYTTLFFGGYELIFNLEVAKQKLLKIYRHSQI